MLLIFFFNVDIQLCCSCSAYHVYFDRTLSFEDLFWVCDAEHLDPINVKIAELREALESVTAEQKYLKARDSRHRHSKILGFPYWHALVSDMNGCI